MVLVIFSAIVVGITGFYGDLNSRYGVTNVNISGLSKAENISDKLNQTYQTATNTSTPVSQIPIIGGIADATWAFIMTAGNVIGLLTDVPSLLIDMVTSITGVFGMAGIIIPDWFFIMIIGVVFIGFIFFLLRFLRSGVV